MKFQDHPTISIQDQRLLDYKAVNSSRKQMNRTELAAWISAGAAVVALVVALLQ